MRRDLRRKEQSNHDKIMLYSILGVVVLLVTVFSLIMYGNSLDNSAKQGQLSSEQIANIVKNEEDAESASSSIGKSVGEAENKEIVESKNEGKAGETNTPNKEASTNNNINTNIQNNVNTKNNSSSNNQLQNTKKQNSTVTTNAQKTSVSNNTSNETKVNNEIKETNEKIDKKELKFQMPVEGDIVKEFSKENLIYSETLQEWTVHNGIDIKAEKTSVVQASEDGVIKSIKNDPRYGLTIVIEHSDGFKTVYANLLSSEFVSEGENVVKGQSIGTVGNTAAFESADEPHLHFEVVKDDLQVDPCIYVKNE